MTERMYEWGPDPRRKMPSEMHRNHNDAEHSLSQQALQSLEPTLGPAESCRRKDEHLQFRPRAYNANKIEGSRIV